MDKKILNVERISLNEDDIRRITDNKAKIISYTELENINNLEDVLEPHGAVILLYETKQNFGHWVALFRRNNNNKKDLEFFDPYALKVDEELNLINQLHIRIHEGIVQPHLTALINQGHYNVIYNNVRLQKFLDHVNTCGRHSSLRIRFRDLSLKEYVMMLTKNKCYDPDFWVSALTILI